MPEIVGMAGAKRTSVREPPASPRDRVLREAAASAGSGGWQADGTQTIYKSHLPITASRSARKNASFSSGEPMLARRQFSKYGAREKSRTSTPRP